MAVNTVSFFGGEGAARPQSRNEVMAYVLDQISKQPPAAPRTIGEGLVRLADTGLQGFMRGKLVDAEKAKQAEKASQIADLLFGPVDQGGTPDPRREMFARAVESGAIDAGSLAPQITDRMFPKPKEPLKLGETERLLDPNNDYSRLDTPPPPATYRPLVDPAERAKFGIQPGDTGPYQVGPDNKVSAVGGGNTNVTTNVDTSGDSFAKEFGKTNAAQFFERRAAAQDAAKSIQANADAAKLLDAGVISGFGADWMVSFGKALQQAGFTASDDAIANTEAFTATRAQEVGRIIKLFGAGTGLSDADREFATKAAAGQITMNEASIRRILDINDRAARNVIENFNEDARQIDPSLSPFPLSIDLPETAAPAAAPTAAPTTTTPTDDGWIDLGNGVRMRTKPQ